MKYLSIIAAYYLLIGLNQANTQQVQEPDKMAWWKEAKFGMFIHWGLYSQTAGMWKGRKAVGNEHFMLYERIPWKEYAKIAEEFNPVNFDADEWIKTARDAGMKYFVITTKHHDGLPCTILPLAITISLTELLMQKIQ